MMIFDIDREVLAYAIMGAIAIVAIPVALITTRRRRREKLRRRGIKIHGH